MSSILLRHLAYFGPRKIPATLSFEPGLNVICGSSETGKSFIIESLDFMLGQKEPVRDIPERDGYDRIRLAIESVGWPPLTLDRSIEGGHFHAYDELLFENSSGSEPRTLREQHSAARQDSLSYVLLKRIGLTEKKLRRNTAGATRSLSFRDLARLCVVTEGEIQGRGSPFLSGQYVTATAEYAVFKLMLTGTDDSALVAVKGITVRRDQETGKIELLDQMIEDLQIEIDEEGAEEEDVKDQITRLDKTINNQNKALSDVQKVLDAILDRRGKLAKEIQNRKARLIEIGELVERFKLLDSHYQNDLKRLEAIHESGSLFVHLEQKPCPLCGALPEDQHHDSSCEGNTESVVKAADVEMTKTIQLRRGLNDTVSALGAEREVLEKSLAKFVEEYSSCEQELNEIVTPKISTERDSYNNLVSKRAEVKLTLEKINRLKKLMSQRADLEDGAFDSNGGITTTKTQISKNILNEFAQTVESILNEWHFPYAERVFFDETKRDFQIAGKERGSTGKGLRAITHAATKIGLMIFCREHDLPHPGFIVLDSPLLAYWKPEGKDDDLRGTDLKEMFYRYLLALNKNNQIIIVENEHPPDFIFDESNVAVFTKNLNHGRYGFFPMEKVATDSQNTKR